MKLSFQKISHVIEPELYLTQVDPTLICVVQVRL